MYEQLSKTVEDVIQVANDIARSYERDYVGTEHLLLAVARQTESVGGRVLEEKNLTPATIRKEVDRLAATNLDETWVFGRLPGTPHFKNVMAHAIEEARAVGTKTVCTHHLLLGLLAEKGSVAERTLTNLHVSASDVRRALSDGQATEP